ncbi:MAG: DUF433 domain-containing protein [bacterium]
MEKSVFIRDTGITVVEVLDELAQGYNCDQIVNRNPKLNVSDILAALKFSADIIRQHITSEEKIEIIGEIVLRAHNQKLIDLTEIRKIHPRAYESWSPNEDNQLVDLFKRGHRIKEIASQLQRQEGAISSRLKKLELIGNKPPGRFSNQQ